jgi:hypothetical protein
MLTITSSQTGAFSSYGFRLKDSRGFPWDVDKAKLCSHESLEADYDDDSFPFERRCVA